MTPPSTTMQVHKMLFVPKYLVTIQVGHLLASVYPKVEPSLPVFECAHAFQVAKSALEALSVDTRLILKAMGSQLNCSNWHGLFDSAWFDFKKPYHHLIP
jgi:hypothetical protein